MREQVKLIELVFLSDKRKKLLLFLKDKPGSMAEIQEHLSSDPYFNPPSDQKIEKKAISLYRRGIHMNFL